MHLCPLDPGQDGEPRAVLQFFLDSRLRRGTVAPEGEAHYALPRIEVQVGRHVAAAQVSIQQHDAAIASGQRRRQTDRQRRLAGRSLAADNRDDLAGAAPVFIAGAGTRTLRSISVAIGGPRRRSAFRR
jgi:hypothetical protein